MLQEFLKLLLKPLLPSDPSVCLLQFEECGHESFCHIAPAIRAVMAHGIGIG